MTPRRPYKLGRRAQLAPDPPFTPKGLQATIGRALGRRYQPPGDTEAVKLCGILNRWHEYFYAAQEDRTLNDQLDEAEKAINTLREKLPKIIAARRSLAEAGDWFSGRMNRHAEALLALLTDANAVGFLQRHDLPKHARDWRWLAKVLPRDIAAAVRPTNPHYRGGRSREGPLVRVLAAIIPDITGEDMKGKGQAIRIQLGKIG